MGEECGAEKGGKIIRHKRHDGESEAKDRKEERDNFFFEFRLGPNA